MRCGVSSRWRKASTSRAQPGPHLRKWSWEAGRRRRSASPNRSDTPGRAGRELADGRDRDLPHHGHVAEAVHRVRRHRQQQLVVLAAVEREREGVLPAFLLERGRAGLEGQRRGIEPGRHPARLAQRREVAGEAVRQVHRGVHEVVLAEGAGEGERRRGIELRAQAAEQRLRWRRSTSPRPRPRCPRRAAPRCSGTAAPPPRCPACPSPPRGRRAGRPRAGARGRRRRRAA